VLDPADPVSIGAMVGPEAFMEVRYLAHAKQISALEVIPRIAAEFEERFGRKSGGLVRGYRCEDAETIVVALGSVIGTLKETIDTMRDAGISVVETPVGDRYLVAAMLDGKYMLGGEQSGHIIMLEHATTGDGLLTALHLLAQLRRQGGTLAGLVAVMTRYPQVLINIPGVDKSLVTSSAVLSEAVAAAEAELGDAGRVLVRPSGTEPAVRVMVEAVDPEQAQDLAARLAAVVRDIG